MCKSRADGGQRCYSHARKALDAALAAQTRMEPLRTLAALGAPSAYHPFTERAIEGRILQAQLDLASTPKGRAEFEAKAHQAQAQHDHDTAARLEQLIERGKILEERNAALKNLRSDPWGYKAPRRPAAKLALTPTQIRENLARPLTNQQAIGVCRDLDNTLRIIANAAGKRGTVTRSDQYRKDLDDNERFNEDARSSHTYLALRNAQSRWEEIRASPTVNDSQEAWREFVTQTRHTRDHLPDNIAFADDYRRDTNYVLRVCGEIAHEHTRRDGPTV